MVARDAKGHWIKGESPNPNGRPKKADEERYTSVVYSVVTPERFKRMLEKQANKAENGNLESFKYVCKLLGLEIDKKELTGKDGQPLIPTIQAVDYRNIITTLAPGSIPDSETPSQNESFEHGETLG